MDDQLASTRCGKFGYENVSGHFIPFIYRRNEKCCATKMFVWHFEKQKHELSRDLIAFDYLKGYEMYNEEVCLINEINKWHNDSKYKYIFGTTDTLIKMDDVQNIFKYVNDCTQKSKDGHKYSMIGGMARIRLSSHAADEVFPYILKNGQRYVPVRCVNSPHALAIETLVDIDVMYIRYLFNVLNMDLPHKKFEIACVNLDQLITHLTINNGGYYDYDNDYWPTKDPSANRMNNNDLSFFTSLQKNSSAVTKPSAKRKHISSKNLVVHLAKIDDLASVAKIPKKDGELSQNHEESKKDDEQKYKRKEKSPSKDVELSKNEQPTKVDEQPKKKNKDEIAPPEPYRDEPKKPPKKVPKKKQTEPTFYTVDYLLDYKKDKNGKEMVLVHWTGFSSADDSWEPISHLNGACKEDVDELRKQWASGGTTKNVTKAC